jgi:hypothetical protein
MPKAKSKAKEEGLDLSPFLFFHFVGTDGSAFTILSVTAGALPPGFEYLKEHWRARPETKEVFWYEGKETHIIKRQLRPPGDPPL